MRKVLLLFIIVLLTGCSTEVTISFDDSSLEPLTGSSGEVVQLPELSREGYGFFGWYLDETLLEPILEPYTFPDEDLTLYPLWKKEISIRLVPNLSTPRELNTLFPDSPIIGYEGEKLRLPNLGNFILDNGEGVVFEGWYLKEEAKPNEIHLYSNETFGIEDLVLYSNFISEIEHLRNHLIREYDGREIRFDDVHGAVASVNGTTIVVTDWGPRRDSRYEIVVGALVNDGLYNPLIDLKYFFSSAIRVEVSFYDSRDRLQKTGYATLLVCDASEVSDIRYIEGYKDTRLDNIVISHVKRVLAPEFERFMQEAGLEIRNAGLFDC
jgi:hypothetical protein